MGMLKISNCQLDRLRLFSERLHFSLHLQIEREPEQFDNLC